MPRLLEGLMICVNKGNKISLQKENLQYSYPFHEDFSRFWYGDTFHEPIYNEPGQTYLAPLLLLRWS
jgi:hypothetical protein